VANLSVTPPLLLQYGHGLFGSQEEVETGYLTAQADSYGYILFACDWWGMAEYDVPAIVAVLNTDPSKFNIIPDRLTQAVVNAHLLMRLMKVGMMVVSKCKVTDFKNYGQLIKSLCYRC